MLGTCIVTFLAAGTFGVSAVRVALAEGAGSAISIGASANPSVYGATGRAGSRERRRRLCGFYVSRPRTTR